MTTTCSWCLQELSLDLNLKQSSDSAVTTSLGSLFQSGMILGKKNICLYRVLRDIYICRYIKLLGLRYIYVRATITCLERKAHWRGLRKERRNETFTYPARVIAVQGTLHLSETCATHSKTVVISDCSRMVCFLLVAGTWYTRYPELLWFI